MFKKIITPLVIIFLILGVFVYQQLSMETYDIPKAVKGTLDLSKISFSDAITVSPDGQWEFYWQKLYYYDDFSKQSVNPDIYANIPELWNTYKINGKQLSKFGYATYRLKVKTDGKSDILSVMIPEVPTSYKMYINNKLISNCGIVGKDKASSVAGVKSIVASFVPPANQFDIIIQVCNFEDSTGGLWKNFHIGNPQSINRLWNRSQQKDMFLIGGFLIMSIYYICIFLLRRDEKSAIYFSAICFIIMVRVSVLDSGFINSLFGLIPFKLRILLDYCSIYWAPVLYACFTFELFPFKRAKVLRSALCGIASIQTVFSIFVPTHVFTSITLLHNFVAVAVILFCLFVLVRASSNNSDAKILIISCAVLIIGLVYDILFENHYIKGYIELTPFALIVSILLQAFIIARRLSRDYKKAKSLSVKLEEMLVNEKDLTDRLKKLDKLKDEFLANTTHELRTPLNGIISMSQFIYNGEAGEVTRKQRESLELILSSSRRLATLINDILDYSRLKNGDVSLDIKSLDINSSIDTALEVFKYMIATKAIKIINEVPKDFKSVMVDENRFYQIIFNIVGNAVKFTEQGEIAISAVKNAGMIEISVQDTGIGIEKEKINDIFKSFEQAGGSINKRYGGTGLGLSITQKIVELHGGKIWAESELGRGTKITFSLPTAERNADNTNNDISKAINSSPLVVENLRERQTEWYKNGEKTVMIVDDESINLQALGSILTSKNYSVILANNGQEALDIINAGTVPDVCILDIMMPKMSGFELCKKLRKKYSLFELPIIFLTAKYGENDLQTGFDLGANDFLHKPVEPIELTARVKTLIDLRSSVYKNIYKGVYKY
jgi:signal transduction histidine kinase/CheY-like chemotaxis protein